MRYRETRGESHEMINEQPKQMRGGFLRSSGLLQVVGTPFVVGTHLVVCVGGLSVIG
jgi:hypothetical protein